MIQYGEALETWMRTMDGEALEEKGTTSIQDTRFSNKQVKLLKIAKVPTRTRLGTINRNYSDEDKVRLIFSDFMTRVAKFDELVKLGYLHLVGIYQERELFRRSYLTDKSDVVDDIIKRLDTNRMKEYVEAGCIPPHRAMQNIIKLHSCKKGLLEHLRQVNVLIDELERLKVKAANIARSVNQSAVDLLDNCLIDDLTQQASSEEEELVLQDKSIFYATAVAAVFRMLKLDYDMQEIIIQSLHLDTPSSELETYCQMWDLRPYIDDGVMFQAWKLV